MIVNCGPGGKGRSDLMRCFDPGTGTERYMLNGQEVPVPPILSPVDYSLWSGRSDAVGGSTPVLSQAYQGVVSHASPASTGGPARGAPASRLSYTAKPNPYTECLYREQWLWRAIERQGGLRGLCCPTMSAGGLPPWVAMPSSGRRFQQIGSILRPGAEGVDFLVTTFQVPVGFDGVIVSVVGMFTGAGFVEGSGDLHYRIQINRRWLKDYGDVQTTMGTVASPCMIYRGGVRLRTQEVARYWVQLGAGALGRLDPLGRIVCAFFGWFYPQV